MSAHNSRRALGSSPVVGSSRKTSAGRPTRDIAIPSPRFPAADRFMAGLARSRVPKALEDFDRRRLARAVRAEQGEHGALLHVERDPVDGLDVRIMLLQIVDVDDRLSHEKASSRARQGSFPEYLLAEGQEPSAKTFQA